MIPYFNVLLCPTSAGHILATDLDVIMPDCWFLSGKYFFDLIMYFTEDTIRLNCHISNFFSFLVFSSYLKESQCLSCLFRS